MSRINLQRWVPIAFAAAIAAGCGSQQQSIDVPAATGTPQGPKFTGPKSDAGVPVTQSADAKAYPSLIKATAVRFGPPRHDPFALTSVERSYDYAQQSERVFGELGGFNDYFTPEQRVAPQIETEPQPYRRLSGVVVGDSVVAIIDMGNGTTPQIIRPGQRIEGTPWTVVSIDQDRAVLRRDGNILPREIEVRLEVAPGNQQPAGQFGPGRSGLPGAGRPGPAGFGAPGGGGGGGGAGAGD